MLRKKLFIALLIIPMVIIMIPGMAYAANGSQTENNSQSLSGPRDNSSTQAVRIQSSRAESFSAIYLAIARQPDMADMLINAAIRLTGEAGNMSPPEVQAARAAGFSGLYEGLARNPEAAGTLINAAIRLTGEVRDIQ